MLLFAFRAKNGRMLLVFSKLLHREFGKVFYMKSEANQYLSVIYHLPHSVKWFEISIQNTLNVDLCKFCHLKIALKTVWILGKCSR